MMRTPFEAWLDSTQWSCRASQCIQDPLDYSTETHHSNMDVFDHLQAGDLMEASAIMAAVVYQAATRVEAGTEKEGR